MGKSIVPLSFPVDVSDLIYLRNSAFSYLAAAFIVRLECAFIGSS